MDYYCADCVTNAGEIGDGWEAVHRKAVTYVAGTAVCLDCATSRAEPGTWTYWVTYAMPGQGGRGRRLFTLVEPIRRQEQLDAMQVELAEVHRDQYRPDAIRITDFELKPTTR